MGLADNFRRAISKKKEEVIAERRKMFIYGGVEKISDKSGNIEEVKIPGCVGNGIKEEIADEIYNWIVQYSTYGFNKSHAAAYAHVTYQTAYLRYHYPVEYMAALISSVIGNPKKIPLYIAAVRNLGIKVLPPNINEGYSGFSASKDKILFGLAAVKGVGSNVVDEIVRERNENGKFSDLEDFVRRLSSKEVNKRTVEALIKAGAFDCFLKTRRQLMAVYEQIIDKSNKDKKDTMTGQMSLFDFAPEEEKQSFKIQYPDVGEFEKEQKLRFEKEMLGVYVSGHPLEKYSEYLKKHTTNVCTDFYLATDEEDDTQSGTGINEDEIKIRDNQEVVIGGIIEKLEKRISKRNGDSYAIALVEDLTGTVECMIWHRQYEEVKGWLSENEKVIISGRAKIEEDKDGKIMCNVIRRFQGNGRKLFIMFSSMEEYRKQDNTLNSVLKTSKGTDEVYIVIDNADKSKRLRKKLDNTFVNADSTLVSTLSSLFGENNVKAVD